MSGIIQLLPDHVANQIAAGEVVQRPASVVKELLENAVDAKATDIKLVIKDAGRTLVQVIDNGVGMNQDDALLCFERHATSKIRQAEDLFSLHTKGFRGEALASIAAISHVELKTKQDQQELGIYISIEGSRFIAQEEAVLPKGTSFSVKNLFYNIPARRNFLKSDTVEFKHVLEEFQRVAMAHSSIHFTFIHNGSELYNLPSTNLRQRIVGLFLGKTNEKLVPVQEETDLVQIQGFVSKPEFAKKTRGEQFFFVNDRFIKSGYLHHAVMAAYEGLLAEGTQPSYFLYLQVPPSSIDINIHPTKTEIKFDDEQALYAILRSTIKHSLGQFNVAPVLDFERDANLDTPYHFKDKLAATPTIQVDGSFNPFEYQKPSSPRTASTKPDTSNWESLYVGLQQDTQAVYTSEGHRLENEEISARLFEEPNEETTSSKPYQLQRKYIVSPIKSGIVIVDQQRAHQRILYEQVLTNMTVNQPQSQPLLFPLRLSFSVHEMHLFHELLPSLQAIGFVFGEGNVDELVLDALPPQLKPAEVNTVLESILRDLADGIPESSFSTNDSIAKSIAKSMAVKTGTYLTEQEQEHLVNSLFACKDAAVSPFHKPTFTTISLDDIDKKFAL
ncbi:MAG: DNA mismatch repair endonuclease MutL [Flavobacterium sp.]|nr:DNA mismatch repair endonuclease MutL [Flavobacterium sp.]